MMALRLDTLPIPYKTQFIISQLQPETNAWTSWNDEKSLDQTIQTILLIFANNILVKHFKPLLLSLTTKK